jgi:predicted double-glycine peptidase
MPVTSKDTLKVKLVLLALVFFIISSAQARSVKSFLEMRRENVVIQEWDLSCGAAALTTLLNYQYGDFVTEKEVARSLMQREEYINMPALVNVRQGFSLLDLKRYVDSRGYKGVGYGSLTLDYLIKNAPIIVPIIPHGYNHFVIFRGIKKNRVLLADPAWGNRTMLVDQFKKLWIDFPKIGHVGFLVKHDNSKQFEKYNLLKPKEHEYVMLR